MNLTNIFADKLYNKATHHLDLSFNDPWQGQRNIESFGHDIEASWLIDEAVSMIGRHDFKRVWKPYIKALANAVDEGLQSDGSMIYERWTDNGHTDTQQQWRVECEFVVGHINLYRHFHDSDALEKARRCWQNIKDHLLANNGEWYCSVDEEGRPKLIDDRAGFCKCPYHNTRMCLETIAMLSPYKIIK